MVEAKNCLLNFCFKIFARLIENNLSYIEQEPQNTQKLEKKLLLPIQRDFIKIA